MLLSPSEVADIFETMGLAARFSPQELTELEGASALDTEGYLVFPTPAQNAELSILGLRSALGTGRGDAPSFFDHPWYLEEPCSRITCPPGWHAIGLEPVAESLGRPVFYAEELKPGGLYLPSAAEVVLTLFLYFLVRGERLLVRKHTWTLDRTREGRFVSIGAFGKKGLFVSSHEVGYVSRGLGICPKIDPMSRTGEVRGI